MMEEMTLCDAREQEVFRRVWQRVMAGHEDQPCPVKMAAAGPASRQVDGDLSCDYLSALVQASPAEGDRPGGDLPSPGMEPPASRECTARLRQQTLEALEGWQFYRHLARRTRGTAARALTGLATDAHRQARRLAAAYFLMSGMRYWPSEQLAAPAISSFWGALRQRHLAEQQAELSYRMAADDTDDPALAELYQQLTEACRGRCRQLRALLEQSCP